jgi:hypothetical protein
MGALETGTITLNQYALQDGVKFAVTDRRLAARPIRGFDSCADGLGVEAFGLHRTTGTVEEVITSLALVNRLLRDFESGSVAVGTVGTAALTRAYSVD